ncbi:molybdenum cofactor guanylyltransferase [Anaerosacchariphilus sp. NSJ-68]|uniref:Probable molybdenum cofactor guanylyltransferase n=2 Tax=Lachnospiraceae TaxID=186803 RepID=A0A923LBT7_9FIRM|nr:molybdenum cofactor guanylyltransferase [Anaerosacchariphilus hominis]MBC5697079.1 molybdenum cofactor guanylyltransferase [Roseburia difficilis]
MPENKCPGEGVSMVVLAGGKSSRMGRDKCDLKIEKSTFLEWQIEKGRKLGITDIQVSGYHGEACSVPVTPDRFPGKGPLGGLESCFRRAREERVLVLGVDMPLLPAEELKRLLEKGREKTKRAMILAHQGKEEPMAGIYDRDLADEMLTEIRERKGSVFAFLNRLGYDLYESSAPEAYFANINCPEDYKKHIENTGS